MTSVGICTLSSSKIVSPFACSFSRTLRVSCVSGFGLKFPLRCERSFRAVNKGNSVSENFKLNNLSLNHVLSNNFSVKGAVTEDEYDPNDPEEERRRVLVSKRLESTARYFRRLGSIGFWGQLICSVVAAVILVFSIIVTGNATTPATTYLSVAGIVLGFVSTAWFYGYMRLSNRLRSAVDNPAKAPPRANVVQNIKSGIIVTLFGTGATLLGMQATVGTLVAKALTSSYSPFLQGTPAGYSPVLALDVFLVQACANVLLSHFLGLVLSLELLRAITLQQPPPDSAIPSPA